MENEKNITRRRSMPAREEVIRKNIADLRKHLIATQLEREFLSETIADAKDANMQKEIESNINIMEEQEKFLLKRLNFFKSKRDQLLDKNKRREKNELN